MNWIVNVGIKKHFSYSNMTIKDSDINDYYCLYEIGQIIVKTEYLQTNRTVN